MRRTRDTARTHPDVWIGNRYCNSWHGVVRQLCAPRRFSALPAVAGSSVYATIDTMEQLVLGWEPQRRTYTVTELNARIRGLLGDEFDDIWVAGEVSGCRTVA